MITIGDLVVDAALREEHALNSEVTSFPVENGSSFTDNIRKQPRTVVIEGLVSDTPLGLALIARDVELEGAAPAPEDTAFSTEAWQQLEAIYEAGEPVAITTSLRLYKNMAMESLTVPRDVKTGAALRFTATFKQIVVVENVRRTVRVATPRGASSKNRGHLPSQYVDPQPTYWCLEDKWVFVKQADRDAANATRSAKTPAVWTDYRIQFDTTYSYYTRICVRKEKITHVNTPVGFGYYRTDKNGKQVPLTSAETDAALEDLRQRTGFNDPLTKPPEADAARFSDEDSHAWWERNPEDYELPPGAAREY